MKTPTTHEREFTALRATVRAILLEHGTGGLAPGTQTSDYIDDVIHKLINARHPGLDRETQVHVERIAVQDPDAARTMSDHHGAIMCAYQDSGYHVGLACGLEIAALAFAGAVDRVTTSPKKGGR